MPEWIADKSENGNCVLKFNNATTMSLTAHRSDSPTEVMMNNGGPLADSGAPYSAIGIVELAVVSATILPTGMKHWNLCLVPSMAGNTDNMVSETMLQSPV